MAVVFAHILAGLDLPDYTQLWWLCAITSTVICITLYVGSAFFSERIFPAYASLSVVDKRDWDSKVFSGFFAVFISILSSYILIADGTFDRGKPTDVPYTHRTSSWTWVALGVSTGYFLVDSVKTVWYHPHMGGTAMLTHHMLAFISVIAGTIHGQFHVYIAWLLLTELTTPFIVARWYLEKLGLKATSVYLYNGLAIFVSWFVGRILLFIPFFQNLWFDRHYVFHAHWNITVLALGIPPFLFALNLFWFSKIVKAIVKRVGPKSATAAARPKAE